MVNIATRLLLLALPCISFATYAMDLGPQLIAAASRGNMQRVKELISAGTSVNAQTSDDGEAPLLAGAYWGNKDIVELLLRHEANVNIHNNEGKTALMKAAIHKSYKDIVELLLKHDADRNARDEHGWTALMWAAAYGCKDIVELLLNYGADINFKDRWDKTALDRAKNESCLISTSQGEKAEYKEIGRILLKALIEQKKLKGAQTAAIRAIEARPGIPTRAIGQYFKQ